MPPRASSIWVYVNAPIGLSTSFAQIQFSAASASGPLSTNLANDVWSISPAVSRIARCSRPTGSNQFCRPYEYSSCGCSPAGTSANQFGRSQPSFSPKHAPCVSNRSYNGDRRFGRPLSCSSNGHAIV